MSQDFFNTSPYQSPNEVHEPAPQVAGPAKRPGGLTAICVIGIVLGSIGVLFNGFAVASSASGASGLEEHKGKSREMDKKIEEVEATAAKYQPVSIASNIVNFLTCCAILAGGIMALKPNPQGRNVLFYSCAFSIVADIAIFALTTIVTMATKPLINEILSKDPNLQGADAGAVTNMAVTMVLACVGFLLLLKLSYYIVTVVYLRKPRARGYYGV